jgi:hypothetical protein
MRDVSDKSEHLNKIRISSLEDTFQQLQNTSMEHHVYFWLKAEFKNDDGRARMVGALNELVKSPNISKAHWGVPAPTEQRPVTDHSWDYGISLHFDTLDAHEKYQKEDPVHDAFSGNHREMWAKVLVMDLA